ncbi:MAG: PAS domain S-box protein [Spirochaetes bacterium]|nr:PAS domain S-box protein [Spirochaetota bacterium]
MNYYSLIPLFSFILNIILVSYIFAIGRNNTTGRAYILFAGFAGFWELSEFFIWAPHSDETILTLLRALSFLFLMTGFLFMNFLYRLSKKPKNTFYYGTFAVILCTIAIAASTDLYYSDIVIRFFYGNTAAPGPLFVPIRAISLLLPGSCSLYIIHKSLRASENPIIRNQMRLLLIGFTLTITIGLATSVVLPDFMGIIHLQPITSSVPVIISVFIFIAIVKYRFLADSIETITYNLFSRIKESVLVLDYNHCLIAINSHALGMLGIEKGLGKNITAEEIFPARYSFDTDCNDLPITLTVKGEQRDILLTQTSLVQSGILVGKLVILNDITERKKAETALIISEANYRRTLDSFENYFFVIDRDYRVVLVNNALAKILDHFEIGSVIIGKTIMEIFPPDTFTDYLEDYRQVFETGKIFVAEKCVTINGKDYHAEEKLIPIIEDDVVMRVATIITDITERRDAENALRISEEKLSKAFNLSPIALSINRLDDGTYVEVNEVLLQAAGMTRDEFIGKTVAEARTFAHSNEYLKFLTILKKDRKVKDFECAFKTKSGDIRLASMSAELLSINGVEHAITALIDITEQRKADTMIKEQYAQIQSQYRSLEMMNIEISRTHRELLETNLVLALEKERLAATLRSIGEGVITVDRNRRVDIINGIGEKITGYLKGTAVGKLVEDILPIYSERTGLTCRDMVDKVLETGVIIEMRINTVMDLPYKQKRHFSAIGAPIRDPESRVDGAIIVFRDISDRVAIEEELVRTSKIESLGVFAGGIAHDFNNLLTSILGNVSMAKLVLGKEKRNQALISEIEKASLRAKDLTLQLLTFSKGGAPVKKTTSIRSLLHDTADFALSGSAVKKEFLIDSTLWNADVDEGQISQVIHNLILNAAQSMPEPGIIQIRASNRVVTMNDELPLSPGAYIQISVVDEGTGIQESNLRNIFDPFFTTKEKGTGLGLAVTYSIIKKHDGHISVDSMPGKGTTFHVYIPATMVPVADRKKRPARRKLSGGKILLMDDEKMVLNVGSRMLSHLGFSVETAENGEDAIRRYQSATAAKSRFDAVIMDLTIAGGMGGKETIGILKNFDPDVVAIVSSGYSNDPIMANYRDHGFRDMVAKPYKIEDLAEVLGRVLKEKSGAN